MAAFWESYLESLDGELRRGFLEKSVRCAGARMIQTALELVPEAPRVPAPIVDLLQVSLTALTEPCSMVNELGLCALSRS